jgi:DNA excision repair protein ERCC-2
LENKKKVFFLTSRHTQHQIAIETLKEIQERHGVAFSVADIIGKKWMCLFPGVEELYSNEFSEFCRQTVEAGKCEFYTNTKEGFKFSVLAKKILEEIKNCIYHAEEINDICRKDSLCPHEIAMEKLRTADVIIADYSYIFHPPILDILQRKTGIELENCIVIVDEGHNMPNRVRTSASYKLSSIMLKNAIKEAKKYQYKETLQSLVALQHILNELTQSNQQKLVRREEFMTAVSNHKDCKKLIEDLEFIAEAVRQLQKKSAIGGVAKFLEAWQQNSDGFARFSEIVRSNNELVAVLQYKCLDPSVVTKNVIEQLHTVVLMSGTLTPTNMYRDLLGFDLERTQEHVYDNPFPEKNRLALVVPRTTTKFSERDEQQFNAIAQECACIANAVKGNTIIFFPSYSMRDKVHTYFTTESKKTVFLEIANMTKEEKTGLLENFKKYKEIGAVLLAAVSGSYGEGIDLPGDLLKCVVVVGLPLLTPDLETKQLIEYFDKKFKRGWDYGYVFPAFNKVLQNAGRCIRSETDRGVIIFLDERYAWPMYSRCFPEDLHVEMSIKPEEDIVLFFGKN